MSGKGGVTSTGLARSSRTTTHRDGMTVRGLQPPRVHHFAGEGLIVSCWLGAQAYYCALSVAGEQNRVVRLWKYTRINNLNTRFFRLRGAIRAGKLTARNHASAEVQATADLPIDT